MTPVQEGKDDVDNLATHVNKDASPINQVGPCINEATAHVSQPNEGGYAF